MSGRDILPPEFQRVSEWLYVSGMLIGGVFFAVCGLIGYDTGKRFYGPGIEARTRWTGEIIWIQVALGIGLFAFGWWKRRALRRDRE